MGSEMCIRDRYWVVSNIYAIIEQIGFNKYFEQQDRKASKAEEVGI